MDDLPSRSSIDVVLVDIVRVENDELNHLFL